MLLDERRVVRAREVPHERTRRRQQRAVRCAAAHRQRVQPTDLRVHLGVLARAARSRRRRRTVAPYPVKASTQDSPNSGCARLSLSKLSSVVATRPSRRARARLVRRRLRRDHPAPR